MLVRDGRDIYCIVGVYECDVYFTIANGSLSRLLYRSINLFYILFCID